jgi:uncharacterized protein (DUF1684 family)
MDISQWEKHITRERRLKDDFFKIGDQSPLSFAEQQTFRGLNYYAPDPNYRFELKLQEHHEKNIVKIEDTQENEREFLRWGEFTFSVNETDCTLQAYKGSAEEDRLFIPFRDATSGKETYGGGRYLDLEIDSHLFAEGQWVLDFNEAYNPWCAYSSDYACPFTPSENRLTVPIPAGEKNYTSAEA